MKNLLKLAMELNHLLLNKTNVSEYGIYSNKINERKNNHVYV